MNANYCFVSFIILPCDERSQELTRSTAKSSTEYNHLYGDRTLLLYDQAKISYIGSVLQIELLTINTFWME